MEKKFKKFMKLQKGKVKKFNIKKEYIKAALGSENSAMPKIKARFDTDEDRVFIKDEKGKEIRPDVVGGILADAVTKKGDVVIYDLRCTKAIPEFLRNKGIITIPCRVGSFNIKSLMRQKKAIFSMEITGHYYFKKFNYCESPLFALKILEDAKKKTGKKLFELAVPFQKYFHSGIIDLRIANYELRITELIKKLKEKYKNGSQNELDGLTVEFSNWWFNIRSSHTEPLLKLVIEAKRKEILEKKKKEILKIKNLKFQVSKFLTCGGETQTHRLNPT